MLNAWQLSHLSLGIKQRGGIVHLRTESIALFYSRRIIKGVARPVPKSQAGEKDCQGKN